ncbi:uncharacterized protein LOC111384344 [Olea europaea var. sylvestris]|uniref:uncharacterized protein LOC111384344 n=1 Tax=Olea europaea var. sylvestris TaxID=158386 RepID=UPI000C1D5EF9|nr:uncharacterized protein LOC111384344 [Olea europaea var. sylvestris]
MVQGKQATASFGVVVSLFPRGRMTHLRFKIPLKIVGEVNCSDEALIVNRCAIEIVDRMPKDIIDFNLPFGVKVVVFGGDFRQVLPVVPRGRKEDIMKTSLVFYTYGLPIYVYHWLRI